MGAGGRNSNKIVFFNFLSTVILQGLTFFSAPLFSRLLGTENYGISSVYLTWVQIISILFTLQPCNTLTIARKEFPHERQKAYESSVLFLSFCVFLACSVVVICFIRPLASLIKLSEPLILMVLIQSFGLCCVQFLNTRLTYDFQADKNAILAIVISACTIGLSLLLICLFPAEDNYWGRVLGQVVVYGIAGAVICFFAWKNGRSLINLEFWKFAIPLTIPMVMHSLSGMIMGQSDRVMLQWLDSAASAGVYSLAVNFTAALSSVWSALNNSWAPFFFEYMKNNQPDEIRRHAKNYLELFTVIAAGFVLLATEVYHVFASEDYWGGTPIIFAIAASHYFTFLYSFAVNYEIFHKKTKAVAIGTFVAAVVNIVLNYIMLHFMGVMGVAVATAISMLVKCLFHHISAARIKAEYRYPFSVKMFLPYVIAFGLVIAFAASVQGLWWLRWGIGAIIGIWELYKIYKRKVIF